jgi:hypothetical protein
MVKIPAFSRRGLEEEPPEYRARKGVALVFFGLSVPWFAWLMIRSNAALRYTLHLDAEAKETWRLVGLWMGTVRFAALALALVGAILIVRSGVAQSSRGKLILPSAIAISLLGQGVSLSSSFTQKVGFPYELFHIFGAFTIAALIAFVLRCGQLVRDVHQSDFPNLASGVIGLILFSYVANWGNYLVPWLNAAMSLLTHGAVSLLTLVLFARLFVKTWRALSNQTVGPA